MPSKKLGCIFLLILALLAGCTSPESVSVKVPEPDYWPTAGWKSSTPEAQGMDPDLLAKMLEDIAADRDRIPGILCGSA